MKRQAIHTAVAALLLVLAGRTFFVAGVLVPLRVGGSSMAPGLKGAHWRFDCGACGAALDVGADQLPPQPAIACPRCFAPTIDATHGDARPGDLIFVDRRIRGGASPARWDVVLAQQPEDASKLCVKRVVGLPGERIALINGDVWANGRLLRKPLEAQRRLRLPVHEEAAACRRWRAETGGWRPEGNGWRIGGAGGTLAYRHSAAGPVTDGHPYNQRVTRRLNDVRDLMLTANLTMAPGASVTLALSSGAEDVAAKLSAGGAELLLDGRLACSRSTEVENENAGRTVTLSLFDRLALLAVGDRTVATAPLALPTPGAVAPPAASVAVSGGPVSINRLTLWRDVYYEARPEGPGAAHGWRLGLDRWLLIGDNQAISRDGRDWAPASGLPGRLLYGRPLFRRR